MSVTALTRALTLVCLFFSINAVIHEVTVTSFRSISMPASFHRHLVGKTLRIHLNTLCR